MKNKILLLLNLIGLSSVSVGASALDCPPNEEVFSGRDLSTPIQFIMPKGGKDDPSFPYASVEKFNDTFTQNNWNYAFFMVTSFADVISYPQGSGFLCEYMFKGTYKNPDGGTISIQEPVIIDYVAPKS
jgi:hypothetical protein